MNIEDLGNRMKAYEDCYSIKMPKKLPVVIRVDGKSFSRMVKNWKCEKPFDKNFVKTMQETALQLCYNIEGAMMAYVQSDEVSVVIRNDRTINTDAWYDNKIQKICSVSASIATTNFNCTFFQDREDFSNAANWAKFDCRAWVLPEHEVQNYMVWRQSDASRNSVSMLGRAFFSANELHGKKTREVKKMLSEKGVVWDELPTNFRLGSCVVKKPTRVTIPKGPQAGEVVEVQKWDIDEDIPIFVQNPEYVERHFNFK